MAVTCDGARVRFYIDSAPDSNQPEVKLRFGVVNQPLLIGADLAGGDEYFAGAIYDARVYGRALSGDEIRKLTAAPPYPIERPQLQWHAESDPSRLVFSWPGEAGSFDLHGSPGLIPPAAWSIVDYGPTYISNHWTVPVPVALDHRRFFRLQQW